MKLGVLAQLVTFAMVVMGFNHPSQPESLQDVTLVAATGSEAVVPLQHYPHDPHHPCDTGDHCCVGGGHDCVLNGGRQACVGSPCSCFVQSEGHVERGFVCHGH